MLSKSSTVGESTRNCNTDSMTQIFRVYHPADSSKGSSSSINTDITMNQPDVGLFSAVVVQRISSVKLIFLDKLMGCRLSCSFFFLRRQLDITILESNTRVNNGYFCHRGDHVVELPHTS